jgi:hypothetical protein
MEWTLWVAKAEDRRLALGWTSAWRVVVTLLQWQMLRWVLLSVQVHPKMEVPEQQDKDACSRLTQTHHVCQNEAILV